MEEDEELFNVGVQEEKKKPKQLLLHSFLAPLPKPRTPTTNAAVCIPSPPSPGSTPLPATEISAAGAEIFPIFEQRVKFFAMKI